MVLPLVYCFHQTLKLAHLAWFLNSRIRKTWNTVRHSNKNKQPQRTLNMEGVGNSSMDHMTMPWKIQRTWSYQTSYIQLVMSLTLCRRLHLISLCSSHRPSHMLVVHQSVQKNDSNEPTLKHNSDPNHPTPSLHPPLFRASFEQKGTSTSSQPLRFALAAAIHVVLHATNHRLEVWSRSAVKHIESSSKWSRKKTNAKHRKSTLTSNPHPPRPPPIRMRLHLDS